MYLFLAAAGESVVLSLPSYICYYGNMGVRNPVWKVRSSFYDTSSWVSELLSSSLGGTIPETI